MGSMILWSPCNLEKFLRPLKAASKVLPILLTASSLGVGQLLASDCDEESKMATEFGTVKPLGENYSSSTIPYEIPAGNDIRAMRLLLSPIQSQGIHWTIVIRNALERPLAALSSEQFSRGN